MSSNHKDDPATARTNRTHQVLGIHRIVEPDGRAKDMARVRLYVGDEHVDEDFPLPQVITVEQQLNDAVRARINELKAGKSEDVE